LQTPLIQLLTEVIHKWNIFRIQKLKLYIMKKFLFLTLILGAIATTNVQAQPADPAAALEQAKQKQKPGLIEKAGLTDAQAEKLIELNFEMRMAASALRGLSEADRSAKIEELKAAKEKKIAALLTPEQIASVNTYYQEMAKNMPQRGGN
jgi:Spy/CpxP family protein refolding chaperone